MVKFMWILFLFGGTHILEWWEICEFHLVIKNVLKRVYHKSVFITSDQDEVLYMQMHGIIKVSCNIKKLLSNL